MKPRTAKRVDQWVMPHALLGGLATAAALTVAYSLIGPRARVPWYVLPLAIAVLGALVDGPVLRACLRSPVARTGFYWTCVVVTAGGLCYFAARALAG